MKKLQKKVLNWANERDIFLKANPSKQAYKTLEECGELLYEIGANNDEGIKDAIGDILVTLIIQCQMQNTSLKECLELAYNEIKDRKGKIVNGTFVKE